MTFVLKELSALKNYFNETLSLFLKTDKKDKIEDLSKPVRKYELQFLSSIMDELERQVSQKEIKPKAAATVFYGAMYVIMVDIQRNRQSYEAEGLLHQRLAIAMGIDSDTKPEDKPNLYQTSKFHTSFNRFLNQIFLNNDSRNGFAKNHMLQAVPIDQMEHLVKISYNLENQAQKKIVTSLKNTGTSKVTAAIYKIQKKSPSSALERFGSWDKLNKDLGNLILDELAHKKVPKIERLSAKRVAQLQCLNAVRDSLIESTIDEGEKIAILAGTMYLVRGQIINEYSSSYVSKLAKLEKSVIYVGLNKIIGENDISSQDSEALISASLQYIQLMTVEPKNKEGIKSIRISHIFSSIIGFDLKLAFNLFIDMIYACRTTSLDHALYEFKKEHKMLNEKQASNYINRLLNPFSLFGGQKMELGDDDDVYEHLQKQGMTNGSN
jgi:hypothetical protein